MEVEREVLCPQNEELVVYMRRKRQEMAEGKRGISENIDKTINRAYANVCGCKVHIKTMRDLSQIKGVGKWILKLMEGFFQKDVDAIVNESSDDKRKKNKRPRRYIPQKNSVSYALLITLYRCMADGKEFMRKQELIDAAEASGLSRVPVGPEKGRGKPGIGSSQREWYSGWSCMKTLITKGLVVKSSCPAKYMLSEEGKEIARECLSRSGIVASDEGLDIIMDEFSNLDEKVAEDEESSKKQLSNFCFEREFLTNEETLLPLQLDGQKKAIDIPPECLNRFVGMGFSKEQINRAYCKASEAALGREVSSLWPTVLCYLREDQIYGPNSSIGEDIAVESSFRGSSVDLKSSTFSGFTQNSSPIKSFPSMALCINKNGGGVSETKSSMLSMPPLMHKERFEDVYDVILVLDDREQFVSQGSRSRKIVENIKMQFNIQIEVRRLPVGDAIWIARHKITGGEYVLDFIVERKKVDDLRSSIRDNRYKDQKLRLLRCGLKRRIYVVEGDVNLSEAAECIKTACFTTEILDGFNVQRTSGLGETLRNYGYLTQAIYHYYKSMDYEHQSLEICPPFGSFIRKCEDLEKVTVTDVFAIQLMQVAQVTEEVACTVIDMYPTLFSLAQAYSLLEGDIRAQEELLKRRSNSVISAAVSKNIFKLIWGS
ncbi:unnamed protein product [Cuscuta campestris]|uniref:Crossover junction endonuclease MUS81 n=1 Tax=Cuscuta campestris TaxID=132261 RepID=A0A484K962_9ASTE|nr:unnamed protein product [Cuscuta campestris]